MARKTGVRRRRANRKVAKTALMEMVELAIASIADRNGSSRAQIAKFISSNYFVGSNIDRQLIQALKRCSRAGRITQNNGRFQLKAAKAAGKSRNRRVSLKKRAVRRRRSAKARRGGKARKGRRSSKKSAGRKAIRKRQRKASRKNKKSRRARRRVVVKRAMSVEPQVTRSIQDVMEENAVVNKIRRSAATKARRAIKRSC